MFPVTKIVSPPDARMLSQLAEAHARAFASQDERPWRPEELLSLMAMPGVSVRVALDGDKVAGFIMDRVAADEAELITLAVSPQYQGQKIALGLMNAMIVDLLAEKISKVFLEVRDDNERAIKLYEDFGFQAQGKRPRYYQTQSGKIIDALCLCLILNKHSSGKEN
ncbi:ribosomal protein S18-alanine N-acetyltransferase [Kordiimonas sp.]|uniref:ribosomal protein S18-alanine N-acetyltransferase n=1 Tax=Kordiimonas sp. TaxID=1970157 RepID=UPI003A921C80